MSGIEPENLPVEGSGGPGLEGGAGGAVPTTPEWAGPSQEEWKSIQEQNQRLAESVEGLTSIFAETPRETPQQGGFDLSQIDMNDPYQAAWLMDQIVQERMASISPYVRNAAQDQGSRQLNELLDKHEGSLKDEFPSGFDKKLAERAAFAFFDETGDAQGSVEAAARYAAEVRKQEREAAIEEYRSKNRKGAAFSDLGASESGATAAPELKTYEEVLNKYASQTEV